MRNIKTLDLTRIGVLANASSTSVLLNLRFFSSKFFFLDKIFSTIFKSFYRTNDYFSHLFTRWPKHTHTQINQVDNFFFGRFFTKRILWRRFFRTTVMLFLLLYKWHISLSVLTFCQFSTCFALVVHCRIRYGLFKKKFVFLIKKKKKPKTSEANNFKSSFKSIWIPEVVTYKEFCTF